MCVRFHNRLKLFYQFRRCSPANFPLIMNTYSRGYICIGLYLKKNPVLWGNSTWSEMGKQNIQAKKSVDFGSTKWDLFLKEINGFMLNVTDHYCISPATSKGGFPVIRVICHESVIYVTGHVSHRSEAQALLPRITRQSEIFSPPFQNHLPIDHFQVTKTLTFKTRLSAKPFLCKWVLFAWG